MSKPASVFFTGMDTSDAEQLIALFHDINRRSGNRWALANDADSASTLVIDVDTLYGHMTWLRAQGSDQNVVALTSGTSAEADHVLHRPVTPETMRHLMSKLVDGSAAAAQPAAAISPAAPARSPAPQPPAPQPPAPQTPVPEAPRASVASTPAPAQPAAVPAPPPAPAKPAQRKLIDLILAGDIPAGPQKLELPDQLPLVLDLAEKAFLCGNSIKAFLPYTQVTLPEGAFKPVSASQFETLRQSIGGGQPLGRLVWLAALGGSGGEIPGSAADTRYRLSKWPQIEREFPKHFRIATTMMKGFQLPSELAEQSGATLAEVNDFIAASLVSGYAEAEQSTASDASPTTQKSLLDRLRGTR